MLATEAEAEAELAFSEAEAEVKTELMTEAIAPMLHEDMTTAEQTNTVPTKKALILLSMAVHSPLAKAYLWKLYRNVFLNLNIVFLKCLEYPLITMQ